MNDKPKIEEEIDFKAVAKTPTRWFGLVYLYFFVLIFIGGLYYVNSLEVLNRNATVVAIIDSTNLFKDALFTKGNVSPGMDLNLIMNPSADMVSKGESLFKANCASCHGENGMGDGPAGVALNPKPRNFHSKDGWVNGNKFSQMFRTLVTGIQKSGMPAYEYLPAQDRVNLIFYIRNFTKDFPVVDKNEVDQLDKEFSLSKGSINPSQIPVKVAKEKLVAETNSTLNKAYKIVDIIESSADANAKIFVSVTKDRLKAATYLASSSVWTNSLNDFIKTVVSNSSTNGFNNRLLSLSKDEWNNLFVYLRGIVTKSV